MKYFFLFITLLFLVGCSSSPIVPYTENQSDDLSLINYPPQDELIKKNIGETMIKSGHLELRDALNITKQTKFNKAVGDSSAWTCALTVEPQTIFLRGKYQTQKKEAECYGMVNTRRTLADGSTNFNCPGAPLITADICKESNGSIFMAFLAQRAELKQDFENLQFVKQASSSKDNFVQEIVYNGRDGNKVSFVYKEYSKNPSKPDFFQEFHSDISNGASVIFKTAKFQIISATGSSIKYKLEQSF